VEGKGSYCLIKDQLTKGLKKFGKNGCVHFTWAVELEKHFILECDAFKDIRESYENMLVSVFLALSFREGIIGKLGQPIINLNQKRTELQRAKNMKLMVS